MGFESGDKVLLPLVGKPVIAYSLETFWASGLVQALVVVVRDASQQQAIQELLPEELTVYWAWGGERRQDSVLSGLQALPEAIDTVFVHDAARPLITVRALKALADQLRTEQAAALAAPATDTVVLARPDALIMKSALPRSQLWITQTPQAAPRAVLQKALQQAASQLVTDEANALHLAGYTVSLVPNPDPNPKLTHPGDWMILSSLAQAGKKNPLT